MTGVGRGVGWAGDAGRLSCKARDAGGREIRNLTRRTRAGRLLMQGDRRGGGREPRETCGYTDATRRRRAGRLHTDPTCSTGPGSLLCTVHTGLHLTLKQFSVARFFSAIDLKCGRRLGCPQPAHVQREGRGPARRPRLLCCRPPQQPVHPPCIHPRKAHSPVQRDARPVRVAQGPAGRARPASPA